jgi:tetratricopeptide (TPR) repeat protein
MISIQSDIAANVASALKAKIEKSERDIIESLPTESFKAHRYNLAARNAYYQQDFATVWDLAHQAITLDPDYFDALQIFSTVNTVLVATPLPDMTSREHFELALQSAEKMIEIAPFRSEGYTQKAVALGTSKQWAGVSDVIDKLVRIQAPSSDLKHIALLLLCMGEFDKAIEIYEANLLTEPVNFFGRGFLMAGYELAGNRAKARTEYEVGEELNPVWWGDTVNTFLALGRNEPVQDVDELIGISDELKYLLSNVNNTGLVKEGLQAFQAKENKISAEALYYAAIAAHTGDNQLALDLMRIALDDVWTSLFWLWLPVFDEARQLESFKQLLRESGIVDFWQQKGWPEVCQPAGDSFECNWTAYSGPAK